jgi:hypothetical protein
MPSPLTLNAPIYLLRALTDCWSCGRSTEVYGIAASGVADDEGTPFDGDEPVLLRHITELPIGIIEAMAAQGAVLRRQASKTAGFSYLANQCGCGALIGDHYLSSEPGAPFFPTDEAGLSAVTVTELSPAGEHDACADYSMGVVADLLEKHGAASCVAKAKKVTRARQR